MAKALALLIASRHSTLYQWMVANREEFAAEKAKAGRPNWQKIAAALAAPPLSLRDANDKPPTGEVVRQTWWRVARLPQPADSPAAPSLPTPTAAEPPAASPASPAPASPAEPAQAKPPAPTATPAAPISPPAIAPVALPRRTFRGSGGEKKWTDSKPKQEG